jgi:hypothetical protein
MPEAIAAGHAAIATPRVYRLDPSARNDITPSMVHEQRA